MTYESNAFVMQNGPVKNEFAVVIVGCLLVGSILALVFGVIAWADHKPKLEGPPVMGQ